MKIHENNNNNNNYNNNNKKELNFKKIVFIGKLKTKNKIIYGKL